MKKNDRFEWIMEWMRQGGSKAYVNVLDSDFVCGYADATGAKATVGVVGAPRCPRLGRDLSEMLQGGLLTRSVDSLPAGDASMGFPNWIYTYSLAGK